MAAFLFALPVRAHSFHASLAQVNYDAGTKRVEIALRLFTNDLEDALGRKAGRKVRVDATEGAEAMALAYLRGAFALKGADGREAALSWVGWEPAADTTWVYVEAELEGGLSRARVADRIFFDLFDDQVNVVNLTDGSAKTSVSFKSGDGEKVVEFGPPPA